MADFDYKVSFLFGAGAEVSFGCPTGVDFTFKTLFFDKKSLQGPLKKFYSKSSYGVNKTFVSKLIFPSYKNKDFRRVVKQSVDSSDELKNILGINEDENLTNETYETIFKAIISQERTDDERKIASLFEYRGLIDSLFYSLTSPEKSFNDYYKIVTFYWKVFFAVVDPIIAKYKDKFKKLVLGTPDKKVYYDSFFRNFKKILFKIQHLTIDDNDKKRCRYEIINHFTTKGILTTNYTPLVKKFTRKRICFLASELGMLENPFNKTVFNVFENDESLYETFPFLMGPSYVKPIIDFYQIEQYSKAILSLKQSNVLIILGHSLGDQDDHIVHFISNFLEKGKIVIYCNYSKTNEEKLPNSLVKIKEKNGSFRCGVVPFSDETTNSELITKIKQKIEELKQ